jgi:hypothetical protein
VSKCDEEPAKGIAWSHTEVLRASQKILLW